MCDWLYVEDYCKAIDLILHNGKVGEVYNIGGHSEMRYAIGLTKIHNELGWLPETKFAGGIKKTIQRYLDNCEWWENIISGEY